MVANRMYETSLSELLDGTTLGRPQSVGCMQVVPLIRDIPDDRFVAIADPAVKIRTPGYGSMAFRNGSDGVLIVPCHVACVVPYAAQDHAMSHAALVKGRSQRVFVTAACIQETQGGLIQQGTYRILILPFALREQALSRRHEERCSKLWQAIIKFNSGLGIDGPGHLEYFLKQFRRELDQFVAEFECVPDQVGAVVVVDGRVVGIERGPSNDYWKSVWSPLIRECYGSLAIQTARACGDGPMVPEARVPLPADVRSLEEMYDALVKASSEEEAESHALVRGQFEGPVVSYVEDEIEGLTMATLSDRRFVGQVIRDDNKVVYASILAPRRRAFR